MLVAHAALYEPLSSSTVTLPPGVKLGASLTGVIVSVNVCGAEVSLPPFAVPPSSCAVTVTVGVPFGATDGCTLKIALLSLVVVKETVCAFSSAGPALIAVAHGAL